MKRRVLKQKLVTVRVTPEMYRKLTQRAKRAGFEDRAEYIRQHWERLFEDHDIEETISRAEASLRAAA